MSSKDEQWQTEDNGVISVVQSADYVTLADVVAFAPMMELSAAAWPERAGRIVAAINALRGQEADDFAQIVEDAMAFRWFCSDDPRSGQTVNDMREQFRMESTATTNLDLFNDDRDQSQGG